jgi:ribonuclease HII
MGILIGMDEAGYGPNLGPLVVAATAWEVAEEKGAGGREQGAGSKAGNSSSATLAVRSADLSQCDLYRHLRRAVAKSASDTQLAIADSKALYKPGSGLRQLERGVHGVLSALGQAAGCWSEVVSALRADACGAHSQLCWHEGFDFELPVDAARDELASLGPMLRDACDGAGVRPLVVRARLVFPAEFNDLCEESGSKGGALSHVTIGLLREILDVTRELQTPAPSPQPPVFALCDKHGARNRYAALLQHHFAEHWIETLSETHAESRYEFGPSECRTHIAFRMKGEEFLPTALASMTAKYLRELSMRAFNEFWCARVPGLRPTAGYPGDAPRFKQAINKVQRELGVDDHVLWRNR